MLYIFFNLCVVGTHDEFDIINLISKINFLENKVAYKHILFYIF